MVITMTKARFRVSARPLSCAGFTIIELMIVIVILVILIGIAGPDFRQLIAATRVRNASFDVFSTLTQARNEALTRNTTVRICRTSNWTSGWTITFAADCSSITAANTIRKHDAYQGLTISESPTSSFVTFSAAGRANTAVSFNIDAPNANAKDKRCVIVDASGRPRTKEGACP
jgi:type IV fimbrial biogenesis protein FimT